MCPPQPLNDGIYDGDFEPLFKTAQQLSSPDMQESLGLSQVDLFDLLQWQNFPACLQATAALARQFDQTWHYALRRAVNL
jgi:hypothetical protein